MFCSLGILCLPSHASCVCMWCGCDVCTFPTRWTSNRRTSRSQGEEGGGRRSWASLLGLTPFLLLFAAATLPRYATVSAKQRKTFRSDEWKNRPKAQNKMLAPSTPPKGIGGLLELNDLVTWPLVRIGETFQIIFKPDSGTGEWTGVGKATTQIQG